MFGRSRLGDSWSSKHFFDSFGAASIAQPDEHGPGKGEAVQECPVDIAAADLLDLAERLRP